MVNQLKGVNERKNKMTENGKTLPQQLHERLVVLISDTEPGGKLPSEPTLAKQMGVSRATLREAMRIFETQGIIHRRQGVGTFVVPPSQIIDTGLEVLESIETLASKINLDVEMGDLEGKSIQANEILADKLHLNPGDPLIQIRRVILTETAPVAYLIDILPEGILNPELLDKQFSGSVLDLIIQMGNPNLSISKTEISAIHAPVDVAKALHIQRGDTLLLLNSLLFNAQGEPIDFSYSYFLPGHFRLHIIRKIGGVSY